MCIALWNVLKQTYHTSMRRVVLDNGRNVISRLS